MGQEKLFPGSGGQMIDGDTLAASITAGADNYGILDLEGASKVGVQIHLTNTDAVGSIYVNQSLDKTNWVAIALANGDNKISVSSGVAVDEILDLSELGGKFLCVSYTRTSGGGAGNSLDVFVTVKRQ